MILYGAHITTICTIPKQGFQSHMALKTILAMFKQVWMSKGARLAEVSRRYRLQLRTSLFQRNAPAQVGDTFWSS